VAWHAAKEVWVKARHAITTATLGRAGRGANRFCTQMKENAMMKAALMISAFTLIFMVSASAQDGTRRGDQRLTGEQQRRDLYEQRRSELMPFERRDNTMLGPQPWWRTQNWCDDHGVLFLCR
jgi:hypothetical protein